MAVPCVKCGELFDLSYDLAKYAGEISVEEVMVLLQKPIKGKKALCWNCRK
ncbi:hypothetical protein J4461_01305 [Candidatus Pacearchaeota archaeon]|nr:hypothetical protein [Candidatus Pacearchaeota archaeon]